MSGNLRLKLDVVEDDELRAQVRDLVRKEVRAIIREDMHNIIEKELIKQRLSASTDMSGLVDYITRAYRPAIIDYMNRHTAQINKGIGDLIQRELGATFVEAKAAITKAKESFIRTLI